MQPPPQARAGAARLGIAVTTYNRSAVVQELVTALETTTRSAYALVVCDDGSTDDTVAALRARGVRVISGQNRGIAWNKNRGLFYLTACAGCDVVLLLDDDVIPVAVGWERDWVRAGLSLGHVNLAHLARPDALLGGRCIPEDPGIATMTSGACIAASRRALAEVGYMDTRFRGYGHEHAEFSLRFLRAGFGGALWNPQPHQLLAYFFVMTAGLVLRDVSPVSDYTQAEPNRELSLKIRGDGIYRHAWRDEAERAALMSELESADHAPRSGVTIPAEFDSTAYLALNPDVAAAGVDPLYHYVAYGAAEGRPWRPSG